MAGDIDVTPEMVQALYRALDELEVCPARAGEEEKIEEALRRMFAAVPATVSTSSDRP